MNQNNNMDDIPQEVLEKMARRLSNFGAILIAAAIVGVCFAIAKIESSSIKIVVAAISAAVGLIGIFLMIVAGVGSRVSPERPAKNNFFLYNRKERQNIEISELTVHLIRDKLTAYMSSFKHRGKLYIGDLFDERSQIPDHFKPLFCYELLCEISDENGADAETFLSFGYECAEIFSKYLSQNEDYSLAMDVKTYILDFASGKSNVEEFKSYLTSKKQYIENKMLDYTKSNIKKFG